MKFKWLKRKYTFMVIPEADSGVVRFRLTGLMMYLIPIVLLLLVILAMASYIVHLRSQGIADELEKQLDGVTAEFEYTVLDKDETIDTLQSELLRLSEQAEETQQKINELKDLEEEIRALTGKGGSGGPQSSAVDVMSIQASEGELGVGGDSLPLSNRDVSILATDTSSRFDDLVGDMESLFDSLSDMKTRMEKAAAQLRVTPTIWPVDTRKVSSDFGYRRDPFNRRISMHNGIDFPGDLNDPIYVTADGVVESVGKDSAHGRNIIVNHGNGYKTWYMHLNKPLVKEGQKVKKGERIGLMGTTGRSTGVHLHYTILKNGAIVNPKPYISASRKDLE